MKKLEATEGKELQVLRFDIKLVSSSGFCGRKDS
jgi:hypothetical protein